MNKEQKQAVVQEIGAELSAASAVFAVDYRGISVPQAAELREKLREADARFSIVKNRLVKRATAEAGAEALEEHLVGPTALTYVRGDAVIAAKAITSFIRAHETIAYKGGLMEGKPLDPEGFKQIARLPALEVLHGQLVGLAASPLTGLVNGLNALVQGLALQLGQIAEQGLVGQREDEEETAEAAEEPAAEEPEEPATEEPEEAATEEPEEPATEEPEEPATEEPEEAATEEPEEAATEDADEGDGAAATEVEPTEEAEPVEEAEAEEGDSPEGEGGTEEASEEPEQTEEKAGGSDSADAGDDEETKEG